MDNTNQNLPLNIFQKVEKAYYFNIQQSIFKTTVHIMILYLFPWQYITQGRGVSSGSREGR